MYLIRGSNAIVGWVIVNRLNIYFAVVRKFISVYITKSNVFDLLYKLEKQIFFNTNQIDYQFLFENLPAYILKLNSNCRKFDLFLAGSKHDGGYLIAKKYLKSDILVSAGIGKNCDFEVEMSKYCSRLILLDPTINALPKEVPKSIWIKKFLKSHSTRVSMNFSEIKRYYCDSKNSIILKIDIEGDEYEVLQEIDFKQINQLIIEFHNFYRIVNTEFFTKLIKVFDTILGEFDIISINSNNFAEVNVFGNFLIPDVLEITFIKKNLVDQEKLVTLKEIAAHRANRLNYPTTIQFPMQITYD